MKSKDKTLHKIFKFINPIKWGKNDARESPKIDFLEWGGIVLPFNF